MKQVSANRKTAERCHKGSVQLSVMGALRLGSFAAKLFLDKSSHRPLMLTYRGVAPRMSLRRVQGPPPAGGRGPAGEPAPDRAGSAPEIVDITLFFDDYRPEDGVTLPHHITRAIGGQTNEELTFKTIKINPAFKAETFAIRN